MRKAKIVENYWNTLTAPYDKYGFEEVINNQNKSSDDSEQEKNININPNDDDNKQNQDVGFSDHTSITNNGGGGRKKKQQQQRESFKKKKQDELLSNIKKRHSVQHGEKSPLQPPNKRRKLNISV